MLERGDMDGCAVWKRIVAPVGEIERTERRQDEAVVGARAMAKSLTGFGAHKTHDPETDEAETG